MQTTTVLQVSYNKIQMKNQTFKHKLHDVGYCFDRIVVVYLNRARISAYKDGTCATGLAFAILLTSPLCTPW
jgi:hypothetical protein